MNIIRFNKIIIILILIIVNSLSFSKKNRAILIVYILELLK